MRPLADRLFGKPSCGSFFSETAAQNEHIGPVQFFPQARVIAFRRDKHCFRHRFDQQLAVCGRRDDLYHPGTALQCGLSIQDRGTRHFGRAGDAQHFSETSFVAEGIPGRQFFFHFLPAHEDFPVFDIHADGTAEDTAAEAAAVIYDQSALYCGKGHSLVGRDSHRQR